MSYATIKTELKSEYIIRNSAFLNGRMKGLKCCNLFNHAVASALFGVLNDLDSPALTDTLSSDMAVNGIKVFNHLTKSNVSINV